MSTDYPSDRNGRAIPPWTRGTRRQRAPETPTPERATDDVTSPGSAASSDSAKTGEEGGSGGVDDHVDMLLRALAWGGAPSRSARSTTGGIDGLAAAHGVDVRRYLEWAGEHNTLRAAQQLDRFQHLLTRLLVTTACLRAASRLAARHEGEMVDDDDGAAAGGERSAPDKLDLDIVKSLLPQLSPAAMAELMRDAGDDVHERSVVDAAPHAGDGSASRPSPAEVEAIRVALQTLGEKPTAGAGNVAAPKGEGDN